MSEKTTEKGSKTSSDLTWRVALLGVVAGLLGSLIGSLTSFGLAVYDADRQEDQANRAKEEEAYAAFLGAAQSTETSATIDAGGDPTLPPRLLDTAIDASSEIFIYGSADAMAAASEVITTLADVVYWAAYELLTGKKPPDAKVEAASDAYRDAIFDYQEVVRDELGVEE